MDEMIAAIRADEEVGRGSCSNIDECMSDEDLAEWLVQRGCTTPAEAVAEARRTWETFRAVADDIAGY